MFWSFYQPTRFPFPPYSEFGIFVHSLLPPSLLVKSFWPFILSQWIPFVLTKFTVYQTGFVGNTLPLMPDVARETTVPLLSGPPFADRLLQPAGQLVLISEAWIALAGVGPRVRWTGKRREGLVLTASNVGHS